MRIRKAKWFFNEMNYDVARWCAVYVNNLNSAVVEITHGVDEFSRESYNGLIQSILIGQENSFAPFAWLHFMTVLKYGQKSMLMANGCVTCGLHANVDKWINPWKTRTHKRVFTCYNGYKFFIERGFNYGTT